MPWKSVADRIRSAIALSKQLLDGQPGMCPGFCVFNAGGALVAWKWSLIRGSPPPDLQLPVTSLHARVFSKNSSQVFNGLARMMRNNARRPASPCTIDRRDLTRRAAAAKLADYYIGVGRKKTRSPKVNSRRAAARSAWVLDDRAEV